MIRNLLNSIPLTSLGWCLLALVGIALFLLPRGTLRQTDQIQRRFASLAEESEFIARDTARATRRIASVRCAGHSIPAPHPSDGEPPWSRSS